MDWTNIGSVAAAVVALNVVRLRKNKPKTPRGAIYMTGGPSGAGKDTLLLAAGDRLVADPSSKVVFIKRHITRDPSKTTDIEIPISEGDFDACKAAGRYALSWEAHSTKYAIPAEDLDRALSLGQRCVLNVSRSVIQQTRDTYGSIADVYFLNITASEASLRTRLLGRGRESVEDVEKRVARAKQSEPHGDHVIHIMNEGSIDEGCTLVIDALAGKLKFSFWLVPRESEDKEISSAIKTLSASNGTKPFATHVTLCPSFRDGQLKAIDKAKVVAAALASLVASSAASPASGVASGGIPVKFNQGISHSNAMYQAVTIEAELTATLQQATVTARRLLFTGPDPSEIVKEEDVPYVPHASLLYGNFDESAREAAAAKANELLGTGKELCMTDLVLVMTTLNEEPMVGWREVGRFPIG
jgi:phosphonate metabolism protein PhnN/1,5-bisphosphokinase (PRPP-forming)